MWSHTKPNPLEYCFLCMLSIPLLQYPMHIAIQCKLMHLSSILKCIMKGYPHIHTKIPARLSVTQFRVLNLLAASIFHIQVEQDSYYFQELGWVLLGLLYLKGP